MTELPYPLLMRCVKLELHTDYVCSYQLQLLEWKTTQIMNSRVELSHTVEMQVENYHYYLSVSLRTGCCLFVLLIQHDKIIRISCIRISSH